MKKILFSILFLAPLVLSAKLYSLEKIMISQDHNNSSSNALQSAISQHDSLTYKSAIAETKPSYKGSILHIYAKGNRYLRVGTDKMLDSGVVYLDTSSIRKISSSTYKYTAIIDISRNDGSEYDFIVNCKNPDSIISIQQRYYSKKRLFKTERLGAGQKRQAFRDSDVYPEYEANLAVCRIVRNK
jgi:hypothetical protein